IEIENDRALVTVDRHVVGRHPMAVWWYPGTSVIPRGAFDLNHRSTEVTKQHGTVRASEYSREVGDQQSVERTDSRRGFLIVLLRHKVHTCFLKHSNRWGASCQDPLRNGNCFTLGQLGDGVG